MNKLERFVYDLVKSQPWLKQLLRNIYQTFFDLLPRKKEYSKNKIILKEGYFFGFHDVTPFSSDNKKVLANELRFDLRMPLRNDEINVGYFEFDGKNLGEFHILGSTRSWNYHKGCRIQWLSNSEIIFNRADENDVLQSQIVNVDNHNKREIDYPIDSVSSDGRFATSFSYERLQKYMPGYGYEFNDRYSFIDEKAPSKTGLYIVDLETNTRSLIVSLKDLADNSIKEEMSLEGYHYVTHSLFSPDGNYVSFFHRWVGKDTRKRYTRLVIYDIQTKTYIIAPTGYMVSHYVWNKLNEIIVYCNYKGLDSHVLLNVADFTKSKAVAYPQLNSDGHQSFINETSFVTDTYPDKYRMAKLYSVDINDDKIHLLASLHSPKKFQTQDPLVHIACDLHPCMSDDGTYVCFDTVKTGNRALAVMKIR